MVANQPIWPKGVAKPAQRALAAAGFQNLAQLTQISEAQLLKLHGMGPKALRCLRQALAEQGLAFAPDPTSLEE
jgi:DNA-directed RNA polymerase alpha subunit